MVRTAVTLEVWNAVNSFFYNFEDLTKKNIYQKICQK